MDKIEKIKAEIERLQNELIQEKKKGFGSDIDDACILELQNVLTYIDTLQEEHVSENLEKETKKWWKEHLHLDPKNQLWMDAHQSIVFAKHFFELGMSVRNKAQKGEEV